MTEASATVGTVNASVPPNLNNNETIKVVTPPSPSYSPPAPATLNGDKNTPSTTTSTKSRDPARHLRDPNDMFKGDGGYPIRQQRQQQQQTTQYPPSQIEYQNYNNGNGGSSNNSHSSNGSEPSGTQHLPLPPLPVPSNPPTHSHHRSWSGGGYPMLSGNVMPAPFPSGSPGAYGTPIMMGLPAPLHGNFPPSMMQPPLFPGYPPPNAAAMMGVSNNQDTIGSTGSSSSRRNKRKDYPERRRVNSYNGQPTNNNQTSYGSMDVAAFFAPPGALPPTAPRTPRANATLPVRSGHNRSDSGDFSPVSEIRHLTGRSSPRRNPMAPLSPSMAPILQGGVHARSFSGDCNFMGAPIPPPLMMPTAQSLDSARSLDPCQQSSRPIIPSRGVFMGDDDESFIFNSSSAISNSLRGSFRGNVPAASERPDSGGEAVFLLRDDKKSKGHYHKKSLRMHMRQQSAQLFMESVKGREQLPSCRDLIFLLLFVFHLIGIVYLGNTYGYESQRLHDGTVEDTDSSITVMYTNLIYIAGLSGIFAAVVSALTLILMTSIAQKIVQVALGLAITFSFVWGTMGIGLSPRKVVPITGIIALALIIAYAFIVWDRIPFTAANLDAGFKGIRANPGAVMVAFVFQMLALGWSIYYTFVVLGVYDAIQLGDLGGQFQGAYYVIYCLLGISYYWTLNVFLNVVQVTVAGVIGRWWYKPDGDTDSNRSDLLNAFFRSCFYSLGSICFGSLIVGPVRILRQLSAFFRPSDQVNSLLCLHECMHCVQTCMTSCVDSLGDRFNSWCFSYVGLYGYGLVDAGLHSTELFEKRGWTTIVSDDLVANLLSMISLGIGGLTGMVAYLLEHLEPLSLTSLGVPLMTSFIVGLLVGLVVSSVLFGIISSSVNAVIVLFAASPVDFEQNHPKLSEDMRKAWREVWPGCMDIIDMRVQAASYLR